MRFRFDDAGPSDQEQMTRTNMNGAYFERRSHGAILRHSRHILDSAQGAGGPTLLQPPTTNIDSIPEPDAPPGSATIPTEPSPAHEAAYRPVNLVEA